ncbi:MAG: hypothetical protein ACREHG_06440, partial [Candidatus Saccharimonadales bacterium]
MSSNFLGLPQSAITDIYPFLSAFGSMFPTPSSGSSSTNSNTNSLINTLAQVLGKTSNQSTGSTTSSSTLSPEAKAILAHIVPSAESLVSPNLNQYESSQIGNINQGYNDASQKANEELAARGLSTSPISSVVANNINSARLGQISNLQGQIPILQNELTSSGIGNLTNILGMLPRSTTTSSNASNAGFSNATNSQQENAQNTGTQNVQQQQKKGGGVSGFLGGLGTALAS